MFIRLTMLRTTAGSNNYFESKIHVNPEFIVLMEREDCVTHIHTNTTSFMVKETPEKIINLIRETN